MKTSATFKLMILFSGMVLVMAAQWRTNSRLRQENRGLTEVRVQAEQVRTDLERAMHTSAENESETQSLRTEVITLRNDLQTVRQELVQAQTAAKTATSSRDTLSRTDARPQPGTPGSRPSRERTTFRMHPTIRTNLEQLPPEHRYTAKTNGDIDDVKLWNSISFESVEAGPDWWPSHPLPLSFTDGEAIAREELRKLVCEEPQWALKEIRLLRMLDGGSAKWHYAFSFAAFDRTMSDRLTVHVSMAGVPGITITGLRVGD